MSPLLLLSLLFITASGSSFLPSQGKSPKVDQALVNAKSFLHSLDNGLKTQNVTEISKLISNRFLFEGFPGVFNKYEMIVLLLAAQHVGKLSITLNRAIFVNEGYSSFHSLETALSITLNLFEKPIDAYFVIFEKGYMKFELTNALVPSSLEHPHVASRGAAIIAQMFLSVFRNEVQFRSKDDVAKMISNNFSFSDCKNELTKQQYVELLTTPRFPNPERFTNIKSALFVNGADVEFTVEDVDSEKSRIKVQFVLHRENGEYVLIKGKLSSCPKNHLLPFSDSYDTASYTAQAFIEFLNRSIASRNRNQVAALFDDVTHYLSCEKKSYTKEQLIDLFLSDATLNQSIAYKSAEWRHHGIISVNITVSGFGSAPFDANVFLVHSRRRVVMFFGRTTSCQQKPETDPIPKGIVHKFIVGLQVSIAKHDVSKFRELIAERFIFAGCTGFVNKEQLINGFSSVAEEQNIEFSVLSVKSRDYGRVEFKAQVKGLGLSFTAKFTLSPLSGRFVLSTVIVVDCNPKSLN